VVVQRRGRLNAYELAIYGVRAAGLRTDEDCADPGVPVRFQN
jgi:hypothetical protein